MSSAVLSNSAGWITVVSDAIAEMVRLEALAEAAYEAMYDARPWNVKDCYDDAMLYLGQAITEADRVGSAADVERLTRRREDISNVYNHQFRGVGC